MSRIEKIAVEDWDGELREMVRGDEATPLEQGATRMFAHNPTLAKGVVAMFVALKQGRSLPERLIELVRLRVAFHNQCRSCMAIRYRDAVQDGVTEDLVCSLERPMEAENLTAAEKAALRYADRFANDHLSIDDRVYAELREHFDEGQIVELGTRVGLYVGLGRLAATWDMTEELPDAFRDKTKARVTPWSGEPVVVR
jgi:AhpD family alkylhydroperoxidase